MKSGHITRIGGISFFVGAILLIISWNFTYPVYIPELNEVTFTQFHPMIWLGLILSLLGLFLTGYWSKVKGIKALCASFFPIILYLYAFYFSYIPSSDSGNVRGMFEVFHHVGINPEIVTYFQYPTYFSLNEITSQILGIDVKGIAYIFFALYGILLGLYLFLFLFKITKKNHNQIAFLGVPIYFIAVFPFINFQWVPQTLALVFFFLLLIFFDRTNRAYMPLKICIFIAFVFTHAFIPAIFLAFFGLNIIKNKRLTDVFLILTCIYCTVLVYYTTFYFPFIIETLNQFAYGLGGEYSARVSGSLRETTGIINQTISLINRIIVPITWLIVIIGLLVEFIKKKLSFPIIALGITGGVYFGIGMFYSILGLRALQILFVPMLIGLGFFISKWKKPTLVFVVIILILAIFGPMRYAYDQTQFHSDEDKNACDFLNYKVSQVENIRVAVGQVNWGYFTKIYMYLNDGVCPEAMRPGNQEEFRSIFNESMERNEYVIYNPYVGKECILYGTQKEDFINLLGEILLNNKIYEGGKTFIVKGIWGRKT
jgi:hypothetical protein